MANVKQYWSALKGTFEEWKEDEASTWAASVAFYAMISLAPLAVLAVVIAGLVFGEQAAQGQLAAQMEGMVGPAGAEVVQTTIANAEQPGSGQGLFATIASIAILFLGASKVFAQLQKALNRMWDVRADPEAGISTKIKKRVVGFGMVLLVGLFLLAAIVASTVVSSLGQVAAEIPGGTTVWSVAEIALSLALFTGLFAMLFKYVPDVEIQWSDVWIGAFVTAVLFTVGKWALGLYFAYGSVGSSYGAAGSLVVLLVWIYYSALIFFFGAEYTQVHARRSGRDLQPTEEAVREPDSFGGAEPA